MEFKQIKDLMASMRRYGLKKLSLKKEGFELELEREGVEAPIQELWEDSEVSEREFQTVRKIQHQLPSTTQGPRGTQEANRAEELAPGAYITSPMVGTFYTSPSPDEPAFVKVGDKVEKNTVVCIIEAMKVMNEIKAGHAGVLAEILVDGSSPVEFGTKLFRVV